MKKIKVNLGSDKGMAEATTLAKRLWAKTNPVR